MSKGLKRRKMTDRLVLPNGLVIETTFKVAPDAPDAPGSAAASQQTSR